MKKIIPLKQQLPTIAIITALPKELAAVIVLIKNHEEYYVCENGSNYKYIIGEVPSKHGGSHQCVLAISDMGNNMSSIRTTQLLQHFPNIDSVIMVGIAGGAPNHEKPDEHVRLGDIVVSNGYGVVQYDFGKEMIDENIFRNPPRPPSPELLQAVGYLQADELMGKRPWENFIEIALKNMKIEVPGKENDILISSEDPSKIINHPFDLKRNGEKPRLFLGTIASGNMLQKNPQKRDLLRDKFGVRAIEMEGSGIADATWISKCNYFVIRGICDYCDTNKGDEWQVYAAIVAAAFTCALLESVPPKKKR